MTKILSKPGSVLNLCVAAIALGVMAWVGYSTLPTAFRGKPVVSRVTLDPPSDDEVVTTLLRLGLSPAGLAAAGASPSQAAGVVTNLRTNLNSTIQSLRDADASFAAARQNYDRLARLIESGRASANDSAAWATAPGQRDNAAASRQTLLSAASAAAVADLPGAVRAQLATIVANNAWDQPTPYLAEPRTDPQWVALRDALANQRINNALGQPMDPACQQLLDAVNADAPVANAAANLQANLASVTAAWNQATRTH